MPAASDNQGLKIAVAAFVALTVILAVTSYFLYTNYAQEFARRQEAENKAKSAEDLARTATTNLTDLRTRVAASFAQTEDYEQLKGGLAKFDEKLRSDLRGLTGEVKKRIDEYRSAGGNDPKVNELEQAANTIVTALESEPNKSLTSTLDRMRELLIDQSLLTTAFAMDNISLRETLKSANAVAQSKIDVHEGELNKSKEDLAAEHSEHEKTRQDVMTKLDNLQTANNTLQTEVERLSTQLRTQKEDYEKKLGDLKLQLAYFKDESQKKETVMDAPDGRITYVSYARWEVYTTLSRRQGARPHMQFAIFDQREPIPNDHPKANIELISVDDRGSLARIVKGKSGTQFQTSADIGEPIRTGDYVYSSAWSPNSPKRFALVGKIDMNRDGKDDRADLKRMIENAGGVVDYDLPPPGAGRESGEMSGRVDFYVEDTRPSQIMPGKRQALDENDNSPRTVEFRKKKTEAIREAQQLGIRPMKIDQLLTSLGYNPSVAAPGRTEGVDTNAMEGILYPRGRKPARTEPAAESGDTPPAAPGDEKSDDTGGDEKPEDKD